MFTGAADQGTGPDPRPEGFTEGQRPDAQGVFGDVFEEVSNVPSSSFLFLSSSCLLLAVAETRD